jgi:hypothetical protein
MPRKKLPRRWLWETMYRTRNLPLTAEQMAEHKRVAQEEHGVVLTDEDVEKALHSDEVWTNARYDCNVTYLDGPEVGQVGALHLSIKRRDRKVIHDWRDLQMIKNDCAGPDREALELYPAESRVIDTANQYHLWVSPKGHTLQVGWNSGRFVTNETGHSGAKQRGRG